MTVGLVAIAEGGGSLAFFSVAGADCENMLECNIRQVSFSHTQNASKLCYSKTNKLIKQKLTQLI